VLCRGEHMDATRQVVARRGREPQDDHANHQQPCGHRHPTPNASLPRARPPRRSLARGTSVQPALAGGGARLVDGAVGCPAGTAHDHARSKAWTRGVGWDYRGVPPCRAQTGNYSTATCPARRWAAWPALDGTPIKGPDPADRKATACAFPDRLIGTPHQRAGVEAAPVHGGRRSVSRRRPPRRLAPGSICARSADGPAPSVECRAARG
jgi:hypothetical protein